MNFAKRKLHLDDHTNRVSISINNLILHHQFEVIDLNVKNVEDTLSQQIILKLL